MPGCPLWHWLDVMQFLFPSLVFSCWIWLLIDVRPFIVHSVLSWTVLWTDSSFGRCQDECHVHTPSIAFSHYGLEHGSFFMYCESYGRKSVENRQGNKLCTACHVSLSIYWFDQRDRFEWAHCTRTLPEAAPIMLGSRKCIYCGWLSIGHCRLKCLSALSTLWFSIHQLCT